nr:hypothetical protein BaRGS_009082 [Batillaria attramentaria]
MRFKNRPGMTFDDTGLEPEQEFEMNPDPEGVLEYNTKAWRVVLDAGFLRVCPIQPHFLRRICLRPLVPVPLAPKALRFGSSLAIGC